MLLLSRFPIIPGQPHRIPYDVLAPYVTNAAFSLELFFKCIYFLDNNAPISGHKLLTLYSQNLSPGRQKEIDQYAEYYAQTDDELKSLRIQNPEYRTTIGCLEASDRAFEYYRYIFEGPMLTDKKAGTYETFELMVQHIILGTRHLIMKIRPDWAKFLSKPPP